MREHSTQQQQSILPRKSNTSYRNQPILSLVAMDCAIAACAAVQDESERLINRSLKSRKDDEHCCITCRCDKKFSPRCRNNFHQERE